MAWLIVSTPERVRSGNGAAAAAAAAGWWAWLSFEDLGFQPDLDPLPILFTLPLRPEVERGPGTKRILGADGRELARAIGSDSRLSLRVQPAATLYQLRRKCSTWYLLLLGLPPLAQQGAGAFRGPDADRSGGRTCPAQCK